MKLHVSQCAELEQSASEMHARPVQSISRAISEKRWQVQFVFLRSFRKLLDRLRDAIYSRVGNWSLGRREAHESRSVGQIQLQLLSAHI